MNEKNNPFKESQDEINDNAPVEPAELPRRSELMPFYKTGEEFSVQRETLEENSEGDIDSEQSNTENEVEIPENLLAENSEPAEENTAEPMLTFEDEEAKKKADAEKMMQNTKKVVGFTLKSVWFVVRKALSYTLNVLMTLLLVGIITGTVVAAVFIKYIQEYIDDDIELAGLATTLDLSTSVYYENEFGEIIEIEDERLSGSENRTWATYSQMPQDLIYAFVCIEDKRFFDHNGVDIRRTFSALVNFFVPMSASYGGGSTITQQLIKNITKEDDVKIQRKVQEILRAINLDSKISKEEILEMYLNTIFLSQNSYGVQTAAQNYFGKDVSELTLVECAALAALPKSPTKYDPIRNPENNLERRRTVLNEMYKQGKITFEQYSEAYAIEELTFKSGKDEEYEEVIHSYYIDTVIEDVMNDLCEKYGYSREIASKVLFSGGLQIVTCMDPFVQDSMEKVFESYDYDFYKQMSGVKAQAAMTVMDPHTGDVLGIVGGTGEKNVSRGLNRAIKSKRQCGSAIKPLSVYIPALELGLITYGTAMDDAPFETQTAEDSPTGKNRAWPPNQPVGYNGLVSINYAVKRSLNTIPVKLVNQMTPQYSFDFLTKKLGFTSLVESRKDERGQVFSDIGLSAMALGGMTDGVTVLDMTAGYTMLANEGVYSAPRTYSKVLDSEKNIILTKEQKHTIAASEESTFIMTKILQNVISDPIGTGRLVTVGKKYGVDVAGKTGSTNDDRDRYFVGYTPYYVGACWFGYDNNKSLGKFSINPALALWDYVMIELHGKINEETGGNFKTFNQPANIVTANYCTRSGMLADEACYLDKGGVSLEKGYFVKGTEPTEKCNVHVKVKWDKKTGAIACAGCPEEDIEIISLVRNEERDFAVQVIIADAQYTYREIPDNFRFPLTYNVPFYSSLIPNGRFVGMTYLTSGHPVNAFCWQHYDPNDPANKDWSITVDNDDEPDESHPDVSTPEESNVDTSEPDISVPDVSVPDVSIPDISIPDISEPDEDSVIIIE